MLLATFGLTVLVDLTVAIEVGMVLAAFLFMRRMAEVTQRQRDDAESWTTRATRTRPTRTACGAASIPTGVEVYEINGPFFFGAAETFKDTLRPGRRGSRRC